MCIAMSRDEFGELRIARDEIGLAVDFDEHADLAAGVNVAGDDAFVGDALGLFRGLRGAALEQQRFCLGRRRRRLRSSALRQSIIGALVSSRSALISSALG